MGEGLRVEMRKRKGEEMVLRESFRVGSTGKFDVNTILHKETDADQRPI